MGILVLVERDRRGEVVNEKEQKIDRVEGNWEVGMRIERRRENDK